MRTTVYSIEELVKSRTGACLLTSCRIDHPTFDAPVTLVENPVSIANGLILQGEGTFISSTQFQLDNFAMEVNDYYNGLYIRIQDTNYEITDYTGGDKYITSTGLPTSGDATYSIIGTLSPFALKFTGGTESDDSDLTATITLDNVDRSVTEYVRSITTPLDITIWVCNIDTPYLMELGPLRYKLRDVTYNKLTLQGTLYIKSGLSFPVGKWEYNNIYTPGLYG